MKILKRALFAAFALVAVNSSTVFSQATSTKPRPKPPTVVSVVPAKELNRLRQIANRVTITRDDWGIAHVRGVSDADAVFGMMYAQAEDDFNRIEVNFLNSLGRMAEAEGEKALYTDLRQRLFINHDSLKAMYNTSPAWLKSLMNGWADGLNFFLISNPRVKPRVITHFEPWMALSFSEGSIGGDIERVNTGALKAFYGNGPATIAPAGTQPSPEELLGAVDMAPRVEQLAPNELPAEFGPPREPTGSNGIAIHPKNTINRKSLLLINPHTSFFFRSEAQVTSEEGLDVYGASTWGQFFVYQGFNPRVGWMHTSSGVDNIDEFLETVSEKDGRFYYKHGTDELPLAVHPVTLKYRGADGTMATKTFTTYKSMHGPVIRKQGDKWVSIALMNSPVNALTQSFIRTKAKSYDEYTSSMKLHTNSSNNTLYADADGNIAYFHSNYIPRRDTRFDWTKPVDGSDPATDYKGVHTFEETPNLLNPPAGWVFNVNDSPWPAADEGSLDPKKYPVYVESGQSSARTAHAIRVLRGRNDFTLNGLVDAAYDSYQTWFPKPIAALTTSYWNAIPGSHPLKSKVAEQIAMLRNWDLRAGENSVETTLAIYWAENAMRLPGFNAGTADPVAVVQALATASDKLTADFGTWKTPWGAVNRFQRLTGDIVHPFSDAGPSIPVGFTSATWGSLASFGARSYNGSKKRYGTSGNSFVAVVEFGDRVKARAVTAGGESGDPKSKHFNDQAKRYATGNLRDVYFYRDQLQGHIERVYKPGLSEFVPARRR